MGLVHLINAWLNRNRELNQQIMVLESDVEEAKTRGGGGGGGGGAVPSKKTIELEKKLTDQSQSIVLLFTSKSYTFSLFQLKS